MVTAALLAGMLLMAQPAVPPPALEAVVLEAWLSELVATHSYRVLPVDESIADQWGRSSVPDPPFSQ